MGSEKFCLRWNDFESNISSSFSELRDDKDFFDVTLSCDDEQIQAHKLIISACSPFFRNVLRRNPHQNPLLYLKGVRFNDLQAVLNFMYHGEVNVAQEDLNSFLAVAEDLKVKGLTQNQAQASGSSNTNTGARSPMKISTPRNPEKAPLPKANPSNSHSYGRQDQEIQEVSIKSEPKEPSMSYTAPPKPPPPAAAAAVPNVHQPAQEDHSLTTYHDDTAYDNYEEQYDDEQHYEEANNTMGQMNVQEVGKGKHEPNIFILLS